ncbi:flagellin FliC [bacterium]|nr:flagellin FliC [bacterium]
MAISVNTNMASLTAQKTLSGSTSKMNVAMDRLSTGYRINSSKDDAAGMAVSTKLNFKLTSFDVANSNAQMGVSLLDTAENILITVKSNLQRIRDLTEQAANGTYGSDSLGSISKEVQARMDEITRLSKSVEFNGKYLLDGSMTTGINLQVGIENNKNSIIVLNEGLFKDTSASLLLNVSGGKVASKYVSDTTAREFLADIDNAFTDIVDRISDIGGYQQRLVTVLDATETMATSTTSALSAIQDADMAAESSEFIKNQILQQMSTSMLSTANQTPAIALSLLG